MRGWAQQAQQGQFGWGLIATRPRPIPVPRSLASLSLRNRSGSEYRAPACLVAELDGQPAAWLSYGVAQLAAGSGAGAEHALQQALSTAAEAEVRWGVESCGGVPCDSMLPGCVRMFLFVH